MFFFNKTRTHLKEGEFYILQNISFSLKKHESLLIIGSKNVRKLIAKLICGLTKPSSGLVRVLGKTRLVSNSIIGKTPFMSFRNYLYLISMLYGLDNYRLRETVDKILKDCQLKYLEDKKIIDIPEFIIKRVVYYTSIFIDSDIYVFDESLHIKDHELRELCRERLEEIMSTRTVVILEETEKELPLNPANIMIIDNGSSLFFGSYTSWIEMHNNFNLLFPRSIKKMVHEKNNENQKIFRSREVIKIKKLISDELDKLLQDNKPVIAGPYISDIGIEILYWIPFLRWLIKNYNLSKNRLITISRCGTDIWYNELNGKHIDICDFLEEKEFFFMINQRIVNGIKQFTITEIEKDILNKITEKIKVDDYYLVHPSLMFNVFLPIWKQKLPADFIKNYTIYKHFPFLKEQFQIDRVPKDYIAVNFSFCPQFPNNSQNRFFLENLLAELCKEYKIINLNTGIQIDRHIDFDFESDKIINIKNLVNYKNLLKVQTDIISNARLFIGTHSGISFLAPLIGVKTLNIYSEMNAGTFPVHFNILNTISSDYCCNYFSVLNIADLKPINIIDKIKQFLK